MSDRPNTPTPPAPLTADEITAWLDFELDGLKTRKAELLATAERWLAAHPVISDDATQGDATENRNMIRDLLKTAEDRREEKKKPFLEGGRAVDGWFNGTKLAPSKGFKAALEKARDAYTAVMTPYAERKAEEERKVREEEARIAQEKADRAQEEAARALAEAKPAEAEAALEQAADAAQEADRAEAAAAAPLTDLSRVHGEFGAVSSLKTTWHFEIIDDAAVPRHLCSPDKSKITAEIKNAGRDSKGVPRAKITGIRIYSKREA